MRMLYALGLVLAVLVLLGGCQEGGVGQPATPVPAATAVAPPVAATSTPTAPVTVVREGEGFRLQAADPYARPLAWAGTTRLLVGAGTGADPARADLYGLDLPGGALRRVAPLVGDVTVVPAPDGARTVLVGRRWHDAPSAQVVLLDLRTGALEMVFDLDPAAPQWPGAAQHWDLGTVEVYLEAAWISPTTFVLRVLPQDDGRIADWGPKLLIVDITAKRVYLPAARGELAAMLPERGLLVQAGWVDGPLVLKLPAYDSAPRPVAPAGPWTTGWTASPDGRRVAWFDFVAPPGDWSRRLPNTCCSGDPQAAVQALAVWDRATDHVQRFPVRGVSWTQGHWLGWRADSSAVLFAGAAADTAEHTALFQMGLDGQLTMLARHPFIATIRVYAEGPDGALYYIAADATGATYSRLTRRAPDGGLTVLRSGTPVDWRVEVPGRLVSTTAGGTTIQDLATGATRQAAVPFDAIFSPDGTWAAARTADGVVRVAPVR